MSAEKLDLRKARELGELPKQEKPLVGREVSLKLVYVDPEGIRHESVVVSRILDDTGRSGVARTAAALANGPWSHLPLNEQARFWAMAWCSWQLMEPPDWINRWIGVDETLLMGVYAQIEKHNSLFFRADVGPGGAPSGPPRLVVASQDPSFEVVE